MMYLAGMKHNGALFMGRPLKVDWTANKDDALNAKYQAIPSLQKQEGETTEVNSGDNKEEEEKADELEKEAEDDPDSGIDSTDSSHSSN